MQGFCPTELMSTFKVFLLREFPDLCSCLYRTAFGCITPFPLVTTATVVPHKTTLPVIIIGNASPIISSYPSSVACTKGGHDGPGIDLQEVLAAGGGRQRGL